MDEELGTLFAYKQQFLPEERAYCFVKYFSCFINLAVAIVRINQCFIVENTSFESCPAVSVLSCDLLKEIG